MHQSLENLCVSLENLSSTIAAQPGANPSQILSAVHGWQHASLTKQDIMYLPLSIAQSLREANIENIDNETQTIVDSIPGKIQLVLSQNVPYFFNGNGQYAIPAFMAFIEWLQAIINPIIGFTAINDPKSMPYSMAKKLRGLKSEMDSFILDKDNLENNIKLIQDATQASEKLPETLSSLKETQEKINSYFTDSSALYAKITDMTNKSVNHEKEIAEKMVIADRLIVQCEDAYRANTTVGLASAFHIKAESLKESVSNWVVALGVALLVAAGISVFRAITLSGILTPENHNWGLIWANIAISAIILSGPVWFAWVATKQISQRFKLAEDYAFKAAVAKAYEGYRKEAARINPLLEERLFTSALTRLEEPPLRVMENNHYSSPWQEFIDTPAFKKAASEIPDLKSRILDMVTPKPKTTEPIDTNINPN